VVRPVSHASRYRNWHSGVNCTEWRVLPRLLPMVSVSKRTTEFYVASEKRATFRGVLSREEG